MDCQPSSQQSSAPMKQTGRPTSDVKVPVDSSVQDATEKRLSAIGSILRDLDEAPEAMRPNGKPTPSDAHQNQLVQVRLGIGTSLFLALRSKHAPTALHSLRVALRCSSWATSMDLSSEARDTIELAALLHDIGKIGVRDHVLLKPGKLDPEEAAMMARHRTYCLEILSGCCPSRELLDIVYYAPAWYDGSHSSFDRQGDDLPLGARMLAIVDAFDSMTTAHVYRPAMPSERAMGEIFRCAGTQFDPQLVQDFHDHQSSDQGNLLSVVTSRWLKQLSPEGANSLWQLRSPESAGSKSLVSETSFHENLIDHMHDGVVFIDQSLQVQRWNRGVERLTGIVADSILLKTWSPRLVDMRDVRGKPLLDADCPVIQTILTGVQTLRRLSLSGREGERLTVDCHVVPVLGSNGTILGTSVLLHDASSESTLEERVQNLHERATRDPLTQLGNRAEFDRLLEKFVREHLSRWTSCSLIICDLDHFKSINDRFGHQAGDEAIVTFARLMQRMCRAGDLVARYGGEEFVMLCADCDISTANDRAEDLRRELSAIQLPMLGGKHITASFGVTELQQGDTPETMLCRADRGLLQAKSMGRDRVIQLGSGMQGDEKKARQGWLRSWFHAGPQDVLLKRTLVTPVPLKVAAEKLKGFVADQHAEIIAIEEDHILLKVEGQYDPLLRRRIERSVALIIELEFTVNHVTEGDDQSPVQTTAHVTIRPKRNRDRRKRDAIERARQLMVSLQSYLMAHEVEGNSKGTKIRRGS